MVFHTAPPQPASNARCTCAPELAGGADASQKGLGERIPAKLILRSAMSDQPFLNRTCRKLPVLHGHHRGCCPARTDAITARIYPGLAGFKLCVHLNEPFFSLEMPQRGHSGLYL